MCLPAAKWFTLLNEGTYNREHTAARAKIHVAIVNFFT